MTATAPTSKLIKSMKPRMRSSRIRTARPLAVVPVCMLGRSLSGGCGPCPGGVVVPVLGGGGGGGPCLLGWPLTTMIPLPCDHVTSPIMHLVSPPPPSWTEWVTQACENINFVRFATRVVITSQCEWTLRLKYLNTELVYHGKKMETKFVD